MCEPRSPSCPPCEGTAGRVAASHGEGSRENLRVCSPSLGQQLDKLDLALSLPALSLDTSFRDISSLPSSSTMDYRVPNGASDESALGDASTAPTTPGGSLSFSPALQPFRDSGNHDVESVALSSHAGGSNPTSDDSNAPAVVRHICCVGAGYVGGPTAAVIASQNPNIRVTVVDRDETRIRRWNSAHPPIYEPGLAEMVRLARDGSRECTFDNLPAGSSSLAAAAGSDVRAKITLPARKPNLFFSTEIAESIGTADIVLIAVNTPTKTQGNGAHRATNMAAFLACTEMVAKYARPGAIIVEKSTVPCGTADMLKETMARHRPGVKFEILSNPEFLAAGTAVDDLVYPERVLIGSAETPSGRRAAEALASVYAAWVEPARILRTNVWSSELAKLVANSMLAQRVSSINSVAAVCEATGADVGEVAASVGIDPRIGARFLGAGIGFGGSCFKKDVLSLAYIARAKGLPEVADYWEQVVKMNEYARDRYSARVVAALHNTLSGTKIAVLGYAFKKNTNDTRESPALEIIRTLLAEGPAEMAVYDPCCNPAAVADEIRQLCRPAAVLKADGGPLVVCSDPVEACDAANAILVVTDFDEFRNTKKQQQLPLHEDRKTAAAGIDDTKGRPADPRPFRAAAASPTELDVLALHRHLVAKNDAADDPLQRFEAAPACAPDCPDCRVPEHEYNATTRAYKPKGQLDWVRIAESMRQPKLVFDGRGVIDKVEMEKLGVHVESVGRRGRY
ncbi:hypothetical protein RB597_006912 [Gaeumannomyces tritici]